MKTHSTLTRNRAFWNATAFLTTAVFSLFLFTACGPDVPTVESVEAYPLEGGAVIEAVGKLVSDGGSEITAKGFCLSKHPNLTLDDYNKMPWASSSVFRVKFYQLEQNTAYYLRAFAINEAGIGYGEVLEVFTSAVALAKTDTAQVLNTTEAILKATVHPQNSETAVWFEVWTSSPGDYENRKRFDLPVVKGNQAIAVSTKATGLSAGEVYYYVVKTENAVGINEGVQKTFRLFYDQVSDYEGNKYWTVKIGNQIWLAENLRTKHFLNGDAIPNVQPDNEWVGMRSPAWCYTNNDPKLGEIYGCLYNNYVGLDPRGLIAGYHTPSIQEYETLVGYLGGGTTAPRKLKSATDDWYNGGKGDNASGFNALPGGG